MKHYIDKQQLQIMERKQKLLIKIRTAITMDRMDLVKELSYELQKLIFDEKELNYSKGKQKSK